MVFIATAVVTLYLWRHQLNKAHPAHIVLLCGLMAVAATNIGVTYTPALIDNGWQALSALCGLLYIFIVLFYLLLNVLELKQTRSERATHNSEKRYRAFVATSAEAIWRVDFEPPVATSLPKSEQVDIILKKGLVSQCNGALVKMYGLDSDEALLNQSLAQIMTKYGELGSRDFQAFIRGNYCIDDLETHFTTPDGAERWFSNEIIGVVENGYLQCLWGIKRETTEEKRNLVALEHQALHDSLTALPNRYLLYTTVEKSLQEHPDSLSALILIDLDRFKEVNDTLGHQAGDALLKQVGPRLSSTLDKVEGSLARLGGDEFAIFLPQIRNRDDVMLIAVEVMTAIKFPFELQSMTVEVGISLGIALYPQNGKDVSSLMRCADIAMYVAKRQTRGFAFYSTDDDHHSPRRLALMTELRSAMKENQLFLHYQPKVDLRTYQTVGLEVLVRWEHPVHGMIPPAHFIPIAETTQLIGPLTLWVLEHALMQWRIWYEQGLKTDLAVNLSVRNLLDQALPAQIRRLIEKHQMDVSCLELEITESAIMADPDGALRVLKQIDKMGVRLSIDDFGTGYSSLAYLKRLPIQKLKIDLSFIRHLTENEHDALITKTITNLAHEFGLKVIAEGVEDIETMEALRKLKCDQVQGYYISRPIGAEEMTQWLRNSDWSAVRTAQR